MVTSGDCTVVEVAPDEVFTEDPLESLSVSVDAEGYENSMSVSVEIENMSQEDMYIDYELTSDDGEIEVVETDYLLTGGQIHEIDVEANYDLSEDDVQMNVQNCLEVTDGEWA